MRRPFARLIWIAALLIGLLALGTLGYRWIEDQSWFDSFYMTLISLTTVGYGETWPLSREGRIFTAGLLLVGATTALAALGVLGDLLFQIERDRFFGRRRNRRILKKLQGHFIVCGAGRVGRSVLNELRRGGAKAVLVDKNPDRIRWAEERDIPSVLGDAASDEALLNAGIDRAKGLVAAIGSDAANVYVTLTARGLSPSLRIAARADDSEAEAKLRRAGANSVFTVYSFVGERLAQCMLRPHVLSLLEVAAAFKSSDLDLEIEQIESPEAGPLVGRTLKEANLRGRSDALILAVKRADGSVAFNPDGDFRLKAGDVLIAMGERTGLEQLEQEAAS